MFCHLIFSMGQEMLQAIDAKGPRYKAQRDRDSKFLREVKRGGDHIDCSELRKFPEQMVLDLASEKECEETSISPFVEPHGFRR